MTQRAKMNRTNLIEATSHAQAISNIQTTGTVKGLKGFSQSRRSNQSNQSGKSIRQAFWALLLGISILAGLWSFGAVPVKAAGFTDIKGSEWYAADVTALAASSNEIIKGYPDGSFRADTKLTAD